MSPEQPILTSENSDSALRGGLSEFQKRLLVQRHVIALMTGSSFEHDPNLDQQLREQQMAAKSNWTLRYASDFGRYFDDPRVQALVRSGNYAGAAEKIRDFFERPEEFAAGIERAA